MPSDATSRAVFGCAVLCKLKLGLIETYIKPLHISNLIYKPLKELHFVHYWPRHGYHVFLEQSSYG